MASRNLSGATSLIEDLDSRVLVVLRDGKHFAGRLVSLDQFSNLVLEDAQERIYLKDCVAEDPAGCMIVRSDNIVMVAKIDEEKEMSSSALKKISYEELEAERERLEAAGQPTTALNSPALWNFDH